MSNNKPLICPYCGNLSVKSTGKEIYPHRPDLYGKSFYICSPCRAYVGCHPNTDIPLGRLANAELRRAKNMAHACFDLLWKSGLIKRGQAYKWLSRTLDIPQQDAHIGMFDVETCKKVRDLSEAYYKELTQK